MKNNIQSIAIFLLLFFVSYTGLILWIDASIIETDGRAMATENYIKLINANLHTKD